MTVVVAKVWLLTSCCNLGSAGWVLLVGCPVGWNPATMLGGTEKEKV